MSNVDDIFMYDEGGIFVFEDIDFSKYGLIIKEICLMKDWESYSEKEIKDIIHDEQVYRLKRSLHSDTPFYFGCITSVLSFDDKAERLEKKYLVKKDNEIIDFRWDLLHGKRRKNTKFYCKKIARKVKRSFDTHNKYAGVDVLYVNAKRNMLVGNDEFRKIERQPWLLDIVQDYSLSLYYDLYIDYNICKDDKTICEITNFINSKGKTRCKDE